MEQHDPTLASARVHVFDLCPRKALCLCSMFQLLCWLPSCGLGTSPSYTQVAPLLAFALSRWWPSRPPFHGSALP
ncbi:unnamed protein product [Musa acuminata subsp. burmannicoides]